MPNHFIPHAQMSAAQIYLTQAKQQKAERNLDVALILYGQAKVAFKNLADRYQLTPPLSQLKQTLSNAKGGQTDEQELLRQRIAEVYAERAQLLAELKETNKADASWRKAQEWGYQETTSSTASVTAVNSKPQMSTQVASVAPMSTQQLLDTSSDQEKSALQERNVELADYLFEKALSTLSSLEISHKPSLFLVYAHDKPKQTEARSDIARYLVDKLSTICVDLYSDQTPLAQPYMLSRTKEEGQLDDILTSQLCLLPAQLMGGVPPVDKVVVCCSGVLGNYLEWPDYKEFHKELRKAYSKDQETYRTNSKQANASAIRQVVKQFSQDPEYKSGFHHVLTEIAFLQIREEHFKDRHGIISVPLTLQSHASCLGHFISDTSVRIGDIPRFDVQAQAGRVVYPNQSQHWVLFKLIERVLVDSDEARVFLNKFWQGYSRCISRLQNASSPPLDGLEFVKLVDVIFDGIRTALHSQLAFTVQQQHQQLRMLHADPRAALEAQYFMLLKQDRAFQETQELYVEPHYKASSTEALPLGLLAKVQELLKNKQVVLLKGDSGAGKTTFNRMLEKQLWEKKQESDPIPLCISLPSIDKPEHDLIAKAFKKRGLSDFQIQKLKQEGQKFVFILDGYDETRQTRNLYLSNRINQPDGWQGQMVISCRSEYLGQGYRDRFQPDLKNADSSFQEIEIEPFSVEERNAYIDNYVKHYATSWNGQGYRDKLDQEPLKNLVSNPFLLRVALDALPYLGDEETERNPIQLRLDLYGQFVKRWFERNAQRLSMQDLTENQRAIFKVLCDEGFAEHGIARVQDLAVHLYTENAGNPVVEYLSRKDKGSWKEAFFGLEDEQQLLRKFWPLNRSGNQYRFIHKSLLEYFVACALFDSFDACITAGSHCLRGSEASIYNFENEPVLPFRAQQDLSLAPKHWVSDLGVMVWLTDRVQQEHTFKDQLLAIIERSKTDAGVCQAAANAITILVKAGVHLSGLDLNNVNIQGADLSYGVFDKTQFAEANLSKARFRNAWLREANLENANLEKVNFGELPTLEMDDQVYACRYSSNNEWLAVSTSNKINLYRAKTLELKSTLTEHSGKVWSIDFSSDKQTLASGSADKKVMLWDIGSGEKKEELTEHDAGVKSISFSQSGKLLASGSEDGKVVLWDVKNKAVLHRFECERQVNSVSFSPNNEFLAAGSSDGTVKLWNVNTKESHGSFEGHDEVVESVKFSPNNEFLASGSRDRAIKLWKVRDAREFHTFKGHHSWVTSVDFSKDSKVLTSGSRDKTVKIWSLESKKILHTLEGHNGGVSSVSFLKDERAVYPKYETLASGSHDKTVRIWKVEREEVFPISTEHNGQVSSVNFSPDGKFLASGSEYGIIKIWSVGNGKGQALRTLKEHIAGEHTAEEHAAVLSLDFSPNNEFLASGEEDGRVILWRVQSGELLAELGRHEGAVLAVSFSSGHEFLASGSRDGSVKIWDVQSKEELEPLGDFDSAVKSISFSSNSKFLACGTQGGTIKILNMDTREAQYTFDRAHTDAVKIVRFLPDSELLISGSYDKTVKLWEISEQERSCSFQGGHDEGISSLNFSLRDASFVSGSWDGTIKVWPTKTGENIATHKGFIGLIGSIVWPESLEDTLKIVVGGSKGSAVHIWQIGKENIPDVGLSWLFSQNELIVTGMSGNPHGLDPLNDRLLKQKLKILPSNEFR